MKYYKLIFYISTLFVFSSCSQDESVASDETGWHYQGRDCLACHNIDLEYDKHLVVAGTMFKDAVVDDVDDLNSVCDLDMALEFLNADYSIAYSTAEYYDANSNGNQGRGNVFLSEKLFETTINGSYYIRVIDRVNGNTMAQSTTLHDFSGAEYTISLAEDFENRLSCNACHNGGVTTPLFVQYNTTLCK